MHFSCCIILQFYIIFWTKATDLYRLDRTAFKRQTAEEADKQGAYWLQKPPQERLRALMYLNAQVYGYVQSGPPKMDKSKFKSRRRMQSEYLYQDFLEFIQALNQNEVRYMLAGGYAVVLHGYQRSTGDLDIWVEPTSENYQRLTAAFEDFRMPVFDMTATHFLDPAAMDVFTFGVPPVAIDIMTKVKGLEFGKAYAKAVNFNLSDGLQVKMLSKEDLIVAKRAAGRAKDFNDIRHLDATTDENE